jgi:hypothetical protein
MIYLHVADFNMTARTLYRRIGFLEVPLSGDSNNWTERGCKIIKMELWRT